MAGRLSATVASRGEDEAKVSEQFFARQEMGVAVASGPRVDGSMACWMHHSNAAQCCLGAAWKRKAALKGLCTAAAVRQSDGNLPLH